MRLKNLVALAASMVCVLGFATTVNAVPVYNDTITAIFGSGNPNTGWVSDTSAGGVQVAVRAKSRTDGTTPNNGAGTYNFATGTPPASTRARWNWEFSANSDADGTTGNKLDDLIWQLSVDTDPSAGVSFVTVNPFAFWPDNELGNNSTANGDGVIDPLNLGLYNVGQNSQNITFGPWLQDPNANATYDYVFSALSGNTTVASAGMRVVVGEGGAPVPDTGNSLGLFALGLLALPAFGRRTSSRS